ncbi:ABC transporter substrate-binding protein [bacterium]|nr:ABC transporter substrate-binding protein [bacterium]
MRLIHTVVTLIVGFALVLFAGSSIQAAETIKIGIPVPLTGPFASVGDTADKALKLAIAEYNAKGGLLGRQLEGIVMDTQDGRPEVVKAVFERLVNSKVDVLMTSYCALSPIDVQTMAKYDVPYFSGIAYHVIADAIEKGMPDTRNVFHVSWSQMAYADSFREVLPTIPAKMGWRPPNNKMAVIRVEFPYNTAPSDEVIKMAQKDGYEVVINEFTQFGKVDWNDIMTKLDRERPAYVSLWLLLATDSALFQKAFVQRFGKKGYDGIVVYQYTPSTPEYMALTKEAAEGVIWMGGSMKVNEPAVASYLNRWKAKYGAYPTDNYATHVRQIFDMWAEAVTATGCSNCYNRVVNYVLQHPHKGLHTNFVFNPRNNTTLYGDGFYPVEWSQIRGGKHIHVYPENKYKEGDFIKPPWMK